jgi:hypothetical protein
MPNKIYSKVHTDKYLSDAFHIQNRLKEPDALLLLLLKYGGAFGEMSIGRGN